MCSEPETPGTVFGKIEKCVDRSCAYELRKITLVVQILFLGA